MENEQKKEQQLTRERKAGFIFLLFFAILTVGLGVLQLRNTIYGPFVIPSAKNSGQQNIFLDETTRLQYIDTDHDGLNDYEELFFYETSPYLPDTDSDGIEDKTELDQGKNPLCPEGTECADVDDSQSAPGSESDKSLASPLMEKVPTVGGLLTGEEAGASGNAFGIDVNALMSNPSELRKVLLSTGKISEEQLDMYSDEQLKTMVQTIINEKGISDILGGSM